MSKAKEYQGGRKFLIRLEHKADLTTELTRFCRKKDIKSAFISAIGAVEMATTGYYRQKERIYKSRTFDEHLEITHLSGNISFKDGVQILHAHIILARENGETVSGHLMSPTIIFACEAFISELAGEPMTREYDETTGLPLWSDQNQ